MLDFYGVVRAHEGSQIIRGIDYEAYPEMARHQLERLADEACEKFPLLGVVLHHRFGFVAEAEPSLFLRISAAHRGPAFEAAQWLITELKQRVPIWKHAVAGSGAIIEPSGGAAPTCPPDAAREASSPDSVA